MKNKTDAGDFFSQLVTLLNKFELLWKKRFCFFNEGAPSMIGKSNSVTGKLKKKGEEFKRTCTSLNLQSVMHPAALCLKSLKMGQVIDGYIYCKIYLCKAFNHLEAITLLKEVESDYG